MHPLPLTFPRYRCSDGSLVALGCAAGIPLRYEVRRVRRGCWELEIEARKRIYSLSQYPSERDAKDAARGDFRRRQIVRLVA